MAVSSAEAVSSTSSAAVDAFASQIRSSAQLLRSDNDAASNGPPAQSDWRRTKETNYSTITSPSPLQQQSILLTAGTETAAVQPPLFACSWLGAHNSGDWLALANTSRSKSHVRICQPQWESNTLKLNVMTQFKCASAARGAASVSWWDSLIAVPTRDGSVALFEWRNPTTSTAWEEPPLRSTLSAAANPVVNQHSGLPPWCLSLDLIGTQLVAARQNEHIVWDIQRGQQPIWRQKVAFVMTPLPSSSMSSASSSDFLSSATNAGQLSSSAGSSNTSMSSLADSIGALSGTSSAPPPGGFHVSGSPSRVVKWAPPSLWPQQVNFARGSLNGGLKVFDIRTPPDSSPSVVWKWSIKASQQRAMVSSIQWCPFVGWWLAAAREDGMLALFDMRYNGSTPLLQVEGCGPLTDLAWSPNSVDWVAATSRLSSRQASIFNWRSSPQQQLPVATMQSGLLSDAPIACTFVPGVAPFAPLLSVTPSGQLALLKLQVDQVKRLAPRVDPSTGNSSNNSNTTEGPPNKLASLRSLTNVPPSNVSVRSIEENIYARQFAVAFRAALELALKLRADSRVVEANRVLSQCYQRVGPEGLPAAIPPPPSLPHIPSPFLGQYRQHASGAAFPSVAISSGVSAWHTMRSDLLTELEFYSYYIPPNYPDVQWPVVDPAVMFDIEVLKMNLELELNTSSGVATPTANGTGSVIELIRSVDDIIEFLNRSISTIDAQLLLKAVQLLKQVDLVAALHLSANVARIYAEWQSGKTSAAGQQPRTGLFQPATTLIDTDGLGAQYFLNLINAAMWPTLFENSSESDGGVSPSQKTFKVASAHSRNKGGDGAATSITWSTAPEYSPIWGQADLKITPDKLSKQLSLARDFYRTLWGGPVPAHMANTGQPLLDVITLFESYESTESSQVLSADVNRLYLKALLSCRHWDRFFIKASQLSEQCRGYPFGSVITSDMATTVPRFVKYCKESQVKAQKRDAVADAVPATPQSPALMHLVSNGNPLNSCSADAEADSNRALAYRRPVRVAALLINILWNADAKYLPRSLVSQLPPLLSQAIQDVELAWSVCLGEDDVSVADAPVPNAQLRAAVRQADEIADFIKSSTAGPIKSLASSSSPSPGSGAPITPRGGATPIAEQPAWLELVTKFSSILGEFAKKTKRRLVQRQSMSSTSRVNLSSSSSQIGLTVESSEDATTPSPRSRSRRNSVSQAAAPAMEKSSDSAPSNTSAATNASSDVETKEAKRLERMASRRAARAASNAAETAQSDVPSIKVAQETPK